MAMAGFIVVQMRPKAVLCLKKGNLCQEKGPQQKQLPPPGRVSRALLRGYCLGPFRFCFYQPGNCCLGTSDAYGQTFQKADDVQGKRKNKPFMQ